jgi:hypothetical protein
MKSLIFLILLVFSSATIAVVSKWMYHPESPTPTTDDVLYQTTVSKFGIRYMRLYNDQDYTVECILQTYMSSQPSGYYSFVLYPNHISSWYNVGATNMYTWNYICY